MATYRCSLIFAANAQGFTETWYNVANDRQAAIQKTINYANIRIAATGFGIELEALRVSNVDVRDDSQLVSEGFSKSIRPFETGHEFTDRDIVWAAVLLNVTADMYHRSFLMRGLKDLQIERDDTNKMVIQSPLRLAINSIKLSLIRNGFSLRVLDRSATNQLWPVTSVSEDPLTNSYVFTIPGLVIAQSQKFVVYNSNVGTIQSANGVQRVRTIGPNNEIITYTPWDAGTVFSYHGNGSARLQVFDYVTVENMQIRDVRKRDTGRRLFATRGRQ